MEWTNKYRLKLIHSIIASSGGVLGRYNIARIGYLCTATDNFLEKNKQNYTDVIEIVNEEKQIRG